MIRLTAVPARRPLRPSIPVNSSISGDPVLSHNEVQNAARALGVSVTTQSLGIFYRITIAPLQKEKSREAIYGYTDGFVLPCLQYMHCDKMEIYRDRLSPGDVLRSHPLWLGLLMCVATFTYAHERGCQTAELLAINDNDDTARRLVRSYRYFGFSVVREIEGGWGDFLEMMMWGGVGTKMQADVPHVLRKWTLSTSFATFNVAMACPEFYVSEKIGMAMGLNNRIGAQGGCQRVFPAIRLRGLPFHVTEDDIRLFLGCDTVDVLMVKKEGRFCGEAFVVLASCLLVDLALTKNKSYMGRRYIEIFRAKKIDYYRAVFAEMTEGSAQLTETRPRRTISDTRGSGETESKAARVVRTTVLKLRGLPFKATPEHVTEWFLGDGLTYETPITAENVYIVKDFGRASGIAFVEFAGLQDAQTAVTKDRQMLGTRYIEIFESTLEERARYMGR